MIICCQETRQKVARGCLLIDERGQKGGWHSIKIDVIRKETNSRNNRKNRQLNHYITLF